MARTVKKPGEMRPGDLVLLRTVAAGQMEILRCERDYRRLKELGLVTHRFTTDDWPRAIAVLTPRGEEMVATQ